MDEFSKNWDLYLQLGRNPVGPLQKNNSWGIYIIVVFMDYRYEGNFSIKGRFENKGKW